jgi:hypothetical protein
MGVGAYVLLVGVEEVVAGEAVAGFRQVAQMA